MLEEVIEAARAFAASHKFERIEPAHVLLALLERDIPRKRVREMRGDPDAMTSSLRAAFRDHSGHTRRLPGTVMMSDRVAYCRDRADASGDPEIVLLGDILESQGRMIHDAASAGKLDAALPAFSYFDPAEGGVPDLDTLIDEVNADAETSYANEGMPPPDPQGTPDFEPGQETQAPARKAAGQGGASAAPRKTKEQEEAERAVERALRDLSAEAETDELNPISGRAGEIARLCEILMRRRKSNVLLVAEPGVGKSALVEGLAIHLALTAGPLSDRPVLEASLSGLVAGARYRGDFESRMELLVDRARARNAILFMDEIHMLMGSGATAERGMDGANILKPAMARDGMSVIGATTPQELEALRADKALMRRFEIVRLREPDADAMRPILADCAGSFLAHHDVGADERILGRVIDFADLYLPLRRFPDKAFDILDGACVNARISGRTRIGVVDIRHAVRRLGGTLPAAPDGAALAGPLRQSRLRKRLAERIGGHDAAIETVTALFATARPIPQPSVLLEGPDGVGRAHLARSLGRALDMREVARKTSEPLDGYFLRLADHLEEDPAVMAIVDLGRDGDAGDRGAIAELVRTGRTALADGRSIDLSGGMLAILRSSGERGVGFVSGSTPGGDELGRAGVVTVRMDGFSGDRLRAAIAFEMTRLSRLWSDAGASRPVPEVPEVLAHVEAGAALTWSDVRQLCNRAMIAAEGPVPVPEEEC